MAEKKQRPEDEATLEEPRPLTPEELYQIAQGRQQWVSRPYMPGTPLASTLASPWRQALLAGLTGGLTGASIGGTIGAKAGETGDWKMPAVAAGIGGLGLGGTAALIAGLRRAALNRSTIEAMKRTPERQTFHPSVMSLLQSDMGGDPLSGALSTLLKVSHDRLPRPAFPCLSRLNGGLTE